MIAMFIWCVIGYVLGWFGTALFLTWASIKFDDYLPLDSIYGDKFITPIMCIIWPVIILLFFIQISCGILDERLNSD